MATRAALPYLARRGFYEMKGGAMVTEFALFVFTTLGGLAAGFYIAAAFFPLQGKGKNLLLSILPLVLIGIGGLALLMHLGRPERMFYAFSNPQAGITQEGFTTGLFAVVLVVDFLLTWRKGQAPRALRYVGAAFALLLTIVMGFTYYNYESMPMWHALPTVLFYVIGDLAMGMLLVGALSELEQSKTLAPIAAIFVALAAVVFAAEGAVFAGCGLSAIPFVVAAVLAALVAVCGFVKSDGASATLRWALFALFFVALVIARYAFYAAY